MNMGKRKPRSRGSLIATIVVYLVLDYILRNVVFLLVTGETSIIPLSVSLRFICCFINECSYNFDGLQIIIGALGIAGGALSVVTSVKLRRVTGILFDDVIYCYFPFYGIAFVLNIVFTIIGQYCCEIESSFPGLLCLYGTAISVVYIGVMCFATVLSENAIHMLTQRYLDLLTSKITSGDNCSDKLKEVRIETISTIGNYISSELLLSTAPFNVNENGIDIQLVKLLEVICPESMDERNEYENNTVIEFANIFKTNEGCVPGGELNNNLELEQAVYLELPCVSDSRRQFCTEVELAYEMWCSLLRPLRGSGLEAITVCRVLYVYLSKKININKSVLLCGLNIYLYRFYCAESSNPDMSKISYIASFVYEMERILNGASECVKREFNELTDNGDVKDYKSMLSIVGDMLYTLLVMATVEQYYDMDPSNYEALYDVIKRVQMNADGGGRIFNLVEEEITCRLCYADVILRQVSSVVPNVRTYRQKNSIKSFVILKLEQQFRARELF